MRRSKLEIHMDILKALGYHGPIRITHIMHKANVCFCLLEEYLSFLIRQGLVAQETLSEGTAVYAITKRGRQVLRCFRELNIALHGREEILKIRELLY